jgi:hypothetical protein
MKRVWRLTLTSWGVSACISWGTTTQSSRARDEEKSSRKNGFKAPATDAVTMASALTDVESVH